MLKENIYYYELTHPQKRIYYLHKINSQSSMHNIGGCLKIFTKLNIDIMKETLNLIIKNNDALRIRIFEENNKVYQYIDEYRKENINYYDFSNSSQNITSFSNWSESIFKKSFKIGNEKLYYIAIYKLNENEYGVLFNLHHIIGDGWTFNLIQKQICDIYDNLYKKTYKEPLKLYSYIDFINEEKEYFNSVRYLKNKKFWNNKFSSVSKDCFYSESTSLEGRRKIFNLEKDLCHRIIDFTKEGGYSLNTFFISMLLIYMNKTLNKNDLIIGTPVFNRTNKNSKNGMGMFTSTVPLNFHFNNKLSASDLINEINRELKLCFVNQKYPYDILIDDLSINSEGYDSLFKVSVNYYNYKFVNYINNTPVQAQEYYCGEQSYSLQITIKEDFDEKLSLNFDYKLNDYKESDILTIYHGIIEIIKQILDYKIIKINNINIIDKKEYENKIYNLNYSQHDYPQKSVCEIFEDQVKKTPNKIALEFENIKLTYDELNKKSNQLANYLRKKHVNKDSIIAIMITHSVELIVAILGVLKSGAAYLPIDNEYPAERINYMLQDSKSILLLTNTLVNEHLDFEKEVININNINLDLHNTNNLNNITSLNDLAYVIYTSGSTGKPKGVLIEHKGLTNYICWAKKTYLKDENEIMPLYSSISFDLTVTTIFTPLVSGNTIIIYKDDHKEFVLYRILKENKATVIKLTPAHLMLLNDRENKNSSIKRIIVGGEDLKVELAKKTYNNLNKRIEIFNEYGPTETVVGCMTHKYKEDIDKGISVPIGIPVDNVHIYILNNDLNILPTGISGEIYISGDGVARGYLNREDLTEEKFIENPFIKGQKMYKTGDMAVYLENGNIQYIGRIDNQVKIRGHRIELGEIEKYLLEYKSVEKALVQVKKNSKGNEALYAYLITNQEVLDEELKKWVKRFLPRYMIPNYFVYMDYYPLTNNGKLDYDALPMPKDIEKEFLECTNEIESKVIEVMKEVLNIEYISMNDNYYQLGGDSIKAIQISSRLKSKELEISVKDILSKEIIQEICSTVKILENSMEIDQTLKDGSIKKTPIIEYFFNQELKNKSQYNQYVFLECNDKLDEHNLRKVLNKLIEHHDTLRININGEEDKLYYNNDHLKNDFSIKYVDVSSEQYLNEEDYIDKIIKSNKENFNIFTDILLKVILVNLGGNKQALLLIAHHLIVDGVSWRIIIEDFMTLLSQVESKEHVILKLPSKTNSFKEWSDFIDEYSKNNFKKELNYWNNISKKEEEYSNIFLKNKNFNDNNIKTSVNIKSVIQENVIDTFMKKTNEVYKVDFNEALIIALIIAINRTTNKNGILIELEKHGRESINNNLDLSRTIGWFTSIYPSYFEVTSKNLNDIIKSIKEQLRSIPNNGFDYGILKFIKRQVVDFKNFYVRFNYLGDFDNIVNNKFNKINFGLQSSDENSLMCLLDIEASIINRELNIEMIYSSNVLTSEDIEILMNMYISVIKEINSELNNSYSIEFTPSDFQDVEISQEDLDSLFI